MSKDRQAWHDDQRPPGLGARAAVAGGPEGTVDSCSGLCVTGGTDMFTFVGFDVPG